MGCVAVNIAIACSSILPTISSLGGIKHDVKAEQIMSVYVECENIMTAHSRIGERLQAKVGIVCSIPEEFVVRFAKDKLVWEGDTNNEGVILYNTLVSTGEWSLEEITIEELL